jgi:DNA invertase Pin-like site-specific DNA recombinase
MKIGYARISTSEQDAAAQVAALRSAGCELIFKEKASADAGNAPSCIACSVSFARVM